MPEAQKVTRRGLLATALGSAALAQKQTSPRIYLDEYQPKSMLAVPEHPVPRARYPVIDVHTHIASQVLGRWHNAFVPAAREKLNEPAPFDKLAKIVRAMDELNLKMCVDLTGGMGELLRRNIADLQVRHKGRFLVCTEPLYEKYPEPGFAEWQAEQILRAKEAGAAGLKVLKFLGLFLREKGKEGPLVKIDDPKFDPMWAACGEAGLPVFIHIADPDAMFYPIDRFNERYETLQNHPDWSFYGKDYPAKQDLLAQRNRVIERHARTIFVGLHVANHAENLDEVGGWLNRYPNLHSEIAARISELGRQPRRARQFFEQFQDRIMFGTDGGALIGDGLYPPYFRFLETLDEYFEYTPFAFANQGRWKIYGIGLPDEILKKVYHNNAARLLRLPLI
jgi:hypothetical protein